MTLITTPIKTVLVTGAAGYIGSTLVHHLVAQGCQVVGLDNLERGHADSLPRGVPLVEGDIRDGDAVREALALFGRPPQACIHLAGLILVGESMVQPARYHDVNGGGTQVVAEACMQAGVSAIALASSAAVLSAEQQGRGRLDESANVKPESPYGASKLVAEHTLQAAAQTGRISAVALRLFNVAGAAYGCRERHDPETHLIPLALAAATGRIPPLRVFGTGLATPDGTCVRDYVHVADVIEAIVRATMRAVAWQVSGDGRYESFHVGSGFGRSVREVLASVETVLGAPVPTADDPPRLGDVPVLVSDPTRLRELLGLQPDPDLFRMIRDCAASLGIPAR